MLSAIHTSISKLAAYAKQIEVTAHNVANVNTNGFKKSRTEFVALETVAYSWSFRRMSRLVLRS